MKTSGRQDHIDAAPKSIALAIVIISDSRNKTNDKSGDYLESVCQKAGHSVVERLIIKDDVAQIKDSLERLLSSSAQLIITSGGTGISGRDNTIPIVESLIDKPIPGFGELFRMLSYKEVKGAAMLSRATAGLAKGHLIFSLPGSQNAVKTAWEGLLKDELRHLVFELSRHEQNT